MLLSNPLTNNTWHPNADVSAVLNLLFNKLGFRDTLQKLSQYLSGEFEYLSEVQARALMKRHCGITLEAGERTQLTRLRKRMEGYRRLLDTFEFRVQRSSPGRKRIAYEREEPLTPIPDEDEWINSKQDQLHFMCFECRETMVVSKGIANFPSHHERVMTLNHNLHLKGDMSQKIMQELVNAVDSPHLKSMNNPPKNVMNSINYEQDPKLFCTVCEEYFEIPEEILKQLDNSNQRITLPSHHDKEMEIKIVSPTKAHAGIAIIQKMLSMNIEEPGLYLACAECSYFIASKDAARDPETGSIIPLTHHGKKMMTISYGGSK